MTLARSLLLAFALLAASALPAAAAAPQAAGHERCRAYSSARDAVIVKFERGTPPAERADVRREAGTRALEPLPGGSQTLEIVDGESVRETVAELAADPAVEYAVPNLVAHAAWPNDPGDRRGLRRTQWNFFGPYGVRAHAAWRAARVARAGGGRGVTVAVVDTGVAYARRGPFRRAPDLNPRTFVAGYDFVQNDRYPHDVNGHGTHVTGTIAQWTNNRRGVTGLAYGVKIMPLRVLDACGDGDTAAIARAITHAVRKGVDVINLSLEFGAGARASMVPDVARALGRARRRGIVVVGASGNDNDGNGRVAYPAHARSVIAVGATTHTGCRAFYSNTGEALDLVAPGGGENALSAGNEWDDAHCGQAPYGRFILQQTFSNDRTLSRFRLTPGYEGTSMATPHVSAAAALVIAKARAAGRRLTPLQVQQKLEASARDLGATGPDAAYGHGLLDAAAALAD